MMMTMMMTTITLDMRTAGDLYIYLCENRQLETICYNLIDSM